MEPSGFHWIPTSALGHKILAENVVHLGVRDKRGGTVCYFARKRTCKNHEGDDESSPMVLYGDVQDGHWPRRAKIIDKNGQCRNEDDYEILMAPKGGYYWVPNGSPRVPMKACPVSLDMKMGPEAGAHLARVYEKNASGGRFYAGFTAAGVCYYQVKGQQELKTSDNFEILAECPPFVFGSEFHGDLSSGSSVGGNVDLTWLNFGWTLLKAGLHPGFLVSTGTFSNQTVFVARTYSPSCSLCFEKVELDESDRMSFTPSKDHVLVEMLLASPGSYIWVERSIAEQLYEKPSEGDYSEQQRNEKLGWDRRIRVSQDENARDWDYWISRILLKGLCFVDETRQLDIRAGFDCLVLTHPRPAGQHSSSGHPSVGNESQAFTFHVTPGAVGWMPVKDARSLGLANAISYQHENNVLATAKKPSGVVARKRGYSGHCIGQLDQLEASLCPEESIEVLWGSQRQCVWIDNDGGYAPNNAVKGGLAADDGGPIYIGRVRLDTEGATEYRLGSVVPIYKGLLFPGFNYYDPDPAKPAVPKYQVLCVTGIDSTQEDTSTKLKKRAGFLQRLTAQKRVVPTDSGTLIEQLQHLQRAELHGEIIADLPENFRRTYEDALVENFKRTDLKVLLEVPAWIPYVSRLTRLYGLPSHLWPLLFHYVEASALPSLKQRVSSVLKNGIRAAPSYSLRADDIHRFNSYFRHLCDLEKSPVNVQLVSDALEMLIAFITSYNVPGSNKRLHRREPIRPSEKFLDLIQVCLYKLMVDERLHLERQLLDLGVHVEHFDNDSDSNTVTEDAILKKAKLKSLVRPTASGNMSPSPDTIMVQNLESYYNSEVSSEMEAISVQGASELYLEACEMDGGVLDLRSGDNDTTADSKERLGNFLSGPNLESARALARSFLDSQSMPLGLQEMRTLTDQVAVSPQSDMNTQIHWALVLSLTKSRGQNSSEFQHTLSKMASMLLEIAAAVLSDSLGLTEAILTLMASVAAEGQLSGLNQADYAQLTSVIGQLTSDATAEENDRRQTAMKLTLSILCDSPNMLEPNSSARDVHALMFKVLEKSEDKMCRILATKCLAHSTSGRGEPLEETQLTFLTSLFRDQVGDVRIYSRIAFAHGLCNSSQSSQFKDRMLCKYFCHCFAVQPLLLSSHTNAEDFTRSVNGLLLKMAKGIQHRVAASFSEPVCKFVEYCTHFFKKIYSTETRHVLKHAFRWMSKLLLPGKLGTAEKLFLRAANEADDEALVVTVLKYITLYIQFWPEKVDSYQASSQFLKTLASRGVRKSHPIYSQCLHMLSSIQEFPDDIFFYYHLEIAALRLGSGDEEFKGFLRTHAIDGCSSSSSTAVTHVTQNINACYNRGLPVSIRSVAALLNCIQSQPANESAWICFQTMTEVGFFFKEPQLRKLFKVVANPQLKIIPTCMMESCLKIIKHQDLPSTVVKEIVNAFASAHDLDGNSVRLVNSIFEKHQIPSKVIANKVIAIGMNAMKSARGNAENLQAEGLSLISLVLGSETISDEIVSKLKECIKGYGTTAVCDVSTEHGLDKTRDVDNSALKLLLQLKLEYPSRVTWEEIHKLADSEAHLLIKGKKPTGILSEIAQLWSAAIIKCGNVENGPESHMLLHAINLLVDDTKSDARLNSLCHYVTRAAGELVPELYLNEMHHMRWLQGLLLEQKDFEVFARLVQALEKSPDARHLVAFGNHIFITWKRAPSKDVEKGCIKLLRLLTGKGWKLESAELREQCELLKRLLGGNNLKIPVDQMLNKDVPNDRPSYSQYKEQSQKHRNVILITNEYILKVFKTFKMKDLALKFLFKSIISDIYNALERVGRVDLMAPLMDSFLERRWESTKTSEDYSYLQRIIFYINHASGLTQLQGTESVGHDAEVFFGGRLLHSKLFTHDDSGESSSGGERASFLLASQLLPPDAHLDNGIIIGYLQQMQSIQSQEQVSSFVQMKDCLQFDLFNKTVTPAPADMWRLQRELLLKYVLPNFKGDTGYADNSRELPDTKEQLREALQQGILDWRHFIRLQGQSTADFERTLAKLLRLIRYYNFHSVNQGFFEAHRRHWHDQETFQCKVLEQLLIQNFKKGLKERGVILEELLKLNEERHDFCVSEFNEKFLLSLLEQVENPSQLIANEKIISEWTAGDIKKWAKDIKNQPRPSTFSFLQAEFIAVANRAVQLLKGWRLSMIQILTAYLALTSDTSPKRNGKFFQVSTGSGKSAIIAIVAAAKALLSKLRVDVYTHNALLARRDAEEWAEFFKLFHIRCSHNAQEEDVATTTAPLAGKKWKQRSRYECEVVYGDTRQFEFDALRTEYLGLNARGARPYECAVLDEVDSIYIDDAEKLTILSSPIAGMELLQPLYHRIWEEANILNESLNLVRINERFFTYEGTFLLDDITQELTYFYDDFKVTEKYLLELTQQQTLLSDEVIKQLELRGIYERETLMRVRLLATLLQLLVSQQKPIPNHLKEFVYCQIPKWVDSAIRAMTLKEGKDYVIIGGSTIVPLDPNNRTTMEMSSWSHGLSPFLQIKHSLEFVPEALQTAYLSNRAMIGRYLKGELVGFSGTLQGTDEFFLHNCDVRVVKMPELNYNCFRLYPQITAKTTAEWNSRILIAVQEEVSNKRAVLVLCKSIKGATRLRDRIQRKAAMGRWAVNPRINLYVRSDDEVKKGHLVSLDNFRAEPGDVIIATLLGARGMDIKAGQLERFGGLHVILTFILANRRLEAQALGRTARQGNYGSAQYIVKASGSSSIRDFDIMEKSYLQSLSGVTFPFVDAKDRAVRDYIQEFRSLFDGLSSRSRGKEIQSTAWGYTFTELDWTLLDAYQEYWALHVASIERFSFGDDKSHYGSQEQDAKAQSQLLLDRLMKFAKLNDGTGCGVSLQPESLFKLTQSCFHPTRYAFQLYSQNKFLPLFETRKKAEKYFELAIEMDQEHAGGAHIGLAYLALLGDKMFYNFPSHEKGYKKVATEHLQRALNILALEMSALQAVHPLKDGTKERKDRTHRSAYEAQLDDRLETLKRHVGILLSTLEFVTSTLRPVYITKQDLTSGRTEMLLTFASAHDAPDLSSSNAQADQKSTFTIAIHGLQWKTDLTPEHEAERAISLLSKRQAPPRDVTLTFEGQNAMKFKTAALKNPSDKFLNDENSIFKTMGGKDEIKIGCNLEDLKFVRDTSSKNLAEGQEIFIQLPTPIVIGLLESLQKYKINANVITFHELDMAEAHSVLDALPKGKDPIAQLSLYPLSDLYATEFKPMDILQQLSRRGIKWVASFHELGSVRTRSNWILAITILAQVAAAAALFATGAGPAFFVPLLAGGAVSDLCSMVTGHFSRQFSWKAFCVAKVVGLAVGMGIGGIEWLLLAEPTIGDSIVSEIANTGISFHAEQYGLKGLKKLVSIGAGLVLEYIDRDQRKALVSQVEKKLEKLMADPKSKFTQSLLHFRAVKRLKMGDSFTEESLSLFFQAWAETTGRSLDRKLSKLKESLLGSLAIEGLKALPDFEFSSGLALGPLVVAAVEFFSKTMNVESTTADVLEAFTIELQDYLDQFNFCSILVGFCGFSEQQVLGELGIPEHVPVSLYAKTLSSRAAELEGFSEEQLSHANVILEKFVNDCHSSGALATGQFVSYMSNFITDYIIGLFSGAACDIVYSELIVTNSPVATSGAKSEVNSDQDQRLIVIPSDWTVTDSAFQKLPDAPEEDGRESGLVTPNVQSPMELLRNWLNDNVTLENKGPSGVQPSQAATFLSKALLFCIQNKYQISFVQKGYEGERTFRDDWSYEHVVYYELNEPRSEIVRVSSCFGPGQEDWDMEIRDVSDVYSFLTKISNNKDAQASVGRFLEKCPDSMLRQVETVVQGLLTIEQEQ